MDDVPTHRPAYRITPAAVAALLLAAALVTWIVTVERMRGMDGGPGTDLGGGHGVRGALRMGTEHGAYCVGCCWGLMVILFALGVMSLSWMAAVAALIFAQKVLPESQSLTRLFAVAFVAVRIWVAAAPGT